MTLYNPDEYDEMYNTGDANKDVYYANITFLDAQIGRFLDKLDTLALTENTIIFFSSDNGPEVMRAYFGAWRSYGTSYPLAGQKRTVWEGGMRVPGMVRWSGEITPRVSAEPNSTLDIMPTICNLIGVKAPLDREIDGSNILPLLLENKAIEREKPLYWQYEYPENWKVKGNSYNRRFDGETNLKDTQNPCVSIRSGNYVLRGIYEQKFKKPDKYVLYDVVNDINEEKELSAAKPEIFEQMVKQLEDMYESVNAERMAKKVIIKQ